METYEILKEIFVNSSEEKLFDALTDSRQIVKYFPLKEVESDWKVGSEVIYKGEVNGSPFTDYGIVEELSRPTIYKYNYWSTNHGTPKKPENYLTISYEIIKGNNGVKLIMKQTNIKSEEMFKLMNDVVWDSLLQSLKGYVEKHAYKPFHRKTDFPR